MKRIAMALVLTAGLVMLTRVSSIVHHPSHASCDDDGGDSGDNGSDDGQD
jgi:hypothetical protein